MKAHGLHRLDVQPHLARGDPAHVEQVLDELRLHAGVSLDDLQPLVDLGLAHGARDAACATSRESRSGVSSARGTGSRGTRPSSSWPARPHRARTARSPAAASAPRPPVCAASNSRALSIATAAWAAMPTTSRSARSLNTSGVGMAEEQAADDLARARDHRHRQVAADGQVAGRHAVMRAASARTGGPAGRLRSEWGPLPERSARTAPSRRGCPNPSNVLAARPDSVYSMKASPPASVVVVEERAELRAAELGRGIGDRLHQRLQVERGRQRWSRSGSAARGCGSRRAAPLRSAGSR